MSTPADYLTYINSGINKAWDACEGKGAILPNPKDIEKLGDTIQSIPSGTRWSYPEEWPPAPPMPEQSGAYLLYKIWPDASRVSFRIIVTNGTIPANRPKTDWGDGVIDYPASANSTTNALHDYDWESLDLPIQDDGSKIVTIYNEGNLRNLTTFYMQLPTITHSPQHPSGSLIFAKVNMTGFTNATGMFGINSSSATTRPLFRLEGIELSNLPAGVYTDYMLSGSAALKHFVTDRPIALRNSGPSIPNFAASVYNIETPFEVSLESHTTATMDLTSLFKGSHAGSLDYVILVGTTPETLTRITSTNNSWTSKDLDKLIAILRDRTSDEVAGTVSVSGTEAGWRITQEQRDALAAKNWNVTV